MIRTSIILVVFLLHQAASCIGQPVAPTTLAEARALWAASGIETYELDWQIECFCVGSDDTIRCSIAGGYIISITNITTHADVDVSTRKPASVEDFFDIIEDAQLRKAAKVDVSYDATYGYPTKTYIDWIRNAIDDEITYLVIALRPRR